MPLGSPSYSWPREPPISILSYSCFFFRLRTTGLEVYLPLRGISWNVGTILPDLIFFKEKIKNIHSLEKFFHLYMCRHLKRWTNQVQMCSTQLEMSCPRLRRCRLLPQESNSSDHHLLRMGSWMNETGLSLSGVFPFQPISYLAARTPSIRQWLVDAAAEMPVSRSLFTYRGEGQAEPS